jgi:hypothetical protein
VASLFDLYTSLDCECVHECVRVCVRACGVHLRVAVREARALSPKF